MKAQSKKVVLHHPITIFYKEDKSKLSYPPLPDDLCFLLLTNSTGKVNTAKTSRSDLLSHGELNHHLML